MATTSKKPKRTRVIKAKINGLVKAKKDLHRLVDLLKRLNANY